ncbi:MAG: EscU/YscU/HrcU family type III secretion system export apparatus switch protein [Treponema sp.]|nr:EscU/YscU/HrcU family type III secretion system export apparatus switch protein [Treponema sp.]
MGLFSPGRCFLRISAAFPRWKRRLRLRNHGKLASAISYDPGEGIPKVVASGRGREAERIIGMARKAGVLVVEDPALAFLLDTGVKPGEFIPSQCWEAVARILAFILKKEKNEDNCS